MKLWTKSLLALLLICSLSVFSVVAEEEAPSLDSVAPSLSEQDLEQAAQNAEKHEFQAEVSRLMDILINSLYSNREIFLRETISNAADALDKIRFLSLTDTEALGEGDSAKLEIKIYADKQAKTLTIHDTGVGMTKKQLMDNLGVIAKSGTTEFLKAASTSENPLNLIGQFGVGFYSVYLVADKVTVVSKNNNDDQYIWESTADTSYTISKDPRGNTLGRGTAVTLHLKEDADEFLNDSSLEQIATKYSEFINYPIYILKRGEVEEEVPVEEEEAEKSEDAEAEKEDVDVSEEEEEEAEEKPKTKKVKRETKEWKRVNEVKAIWTRPAKEITDQEYTDFYKALTKDQNGHLAKTHFSAEGEISFKSLLYIPKKAPAGLYDRFYDKNDGLKLYVRRVMVSDSFDELVPRYLNFLRGVVDSDDLPLQVSRENLAQNRVLKVMGKKITRKALELLVKLSEASAEYEEEQKKKTEENTEDAETPELSEDEKLEKDPYPTFWQEYGKSIKVGVIDDRSNRSKLSKLLRFVTSKSEDKPISLDQYVARMKKNQKNIYFIAGESVEAVKKSPFVERLLAKDLEVLYMVDPLDEYLINSLTEFDGHQLQSVTKENLKIEGDDEKRLKKVKEEFEEFTAWLKNVYGDRVEKITVSNRIAKSPVVIVTGQYGWSANMERIARAQTFSKAEEATYMHARKIMEINPFHPIIKELKSKVAANPDDSNLTNLANLLYDSALVSSGFNIRDASEFSSRINSVIANNLEVDPNAPVEEPVVEEVEEESNEEEEEESEEVSHDEL